MSSDIYLNGITYPSSRKVAFPGKDGKEVVFDLPEDADAGLNAYSERPVQNKVIHAAIEDVRQRQTSPYNFKGSVAAAANLPSSGNTVNDTYYVEALKHRMTWTGSAWQQSSMDESQYADELSAADAAIDGLRDLAFTGGELYYSAWTIPGGINPTTGAAGGSFAAGKARTGNIPLADRAPLAVRFDTAKYAAMVWGYDAEGTAVKCYTNNDFSGRHVLIPKDDAVTRIRLCLKRTDNQAMTTDADDPTSDVNVIPATTFLQYLTDRTLSKDGSIADAKAVGKAVSAVQEDVDRRTQELIKTMGSAAENQPTWMFGPGIRPSDGINIGPFDTYCRTGYRPCAGTQKGVILSDPDYLMTVWTYGDHNDNDPVYSPTGKTYTNRAAIVPVTDGANYFRIGVMRADGAALSTDLTDPDSDACKIAAGITVYDLIDGPESNEDGPDIRNIRTAIAGGTLHPALEQGSANYYAGYLKPSDSKTRCRTPIDHPMLCFAGDRISCGAMYLYVRQCSPTPDGYVLVRRVNDNFATGSLTIPSTGLYHMVVQNAADNSECTDLTPDDAAAEITVTHYGIKAGASGGPGGALTLPKNPYLTVVWDQVAEKTSFTHGHCNSQAVFNRLREHYDHLAISNYHASRPTYPASKYFEGADGILESPNAEHVYFPGYSSHVHLNSVGSFLASGVSNTAAGSGGYQGTMEDFMARAEALLKYPNAGGVTINHPDFSGLSPAAVIALASIGPVFATEIVNGSTSESERTENNLAIWDGVLAEGFQLFGVCTPDWGVSQRAAEGEIGYGYNHMLVYSGTEQEILLAYRNGLFYGTIFNDGLKLVYFGIHDGTVTFTANQAGKIKFVTANGTTVLDNVATATYDVQEGDVYVRAEIQTSGNRLFTNAIML